MPSGAKKKTIPDSLEMAINDALSAMTKARAAVQDAQVQRALDDAGQKLAGACQDAGGGAEYPG